MENLGNTILKQRLTEKGRNEAMPKRTSCKNLSKRSNQTLA
jgi:hypothetical protein